MDYLKKIPSELKVAVHYKLLVHCLCCLCRCDDVDKTLLPKKFKPPALILKKDV